MARGATTEVMLAVRGTSSRDGRSRRNSGNEHCHDDAHATIPLFERQMTRNSCDANGGIHADIALGYVSVRAGFAEFLSQPRQTRMAARRQPLLHAIQIEVDDRRGI
jgi:hypothetical protein